VLTTGMMVSENRSSGVAVRRSGHAAAFLAKRGREAPRENLVHSQGARVYKVRKRGFRNMSYFRSARLPGSGAMLCLFTVAFGLLATGAARAQTAQPLVDEKTLTRVSEHVYALAGWPNIGIVVGSRGTLVIVISLLLGWGLAGARWVPARSLPVGGVLPARGTPAGALAP